MNDTSTTLISVESLINSSQSKLTTLSQELRQHREMLASQLDNDEEYRRLEAESQKANKLKKVAQARVYRGPEAMRLIDEIKDRQSQVRDIKKALSDYLAQYINLSGSRQIEAPSGELFEIIYSAKLAKAK